MSDYNEKIEAMTQPELALELCDLLEVYQVLREDDEAKQADSRESLKSACIRLNEINETMTAAEEEDEEDSTSGAGVSANIIRTDAALN